MSDQKVFEINFNKCKEKNFPMFGRPLVSGYFSLDEDRKYLPDASRLQYLHLPKNLRKVHLDLNDNFGTATEKAESAHEEKITHMLKFILSYIIPKNEFPNKEKIVDSDFVCFRGLLNTIMTTPYNERDSWIILASRWKDTIYLCAVDSDEKKQGRLNATQREKRFQAWGYKFEQYLLTDSPDKMADTSKPVLETEEFCCVFNSILNTKKLLYGAEMDGVISDIALPEKPNLKNIEFVELKTNRHIENRRQDYNFRKYKLIKWWSQSFLVGIKQIYCGYRNDDGIVEEIKPYTVSELSKMAHNFWDPTVCMNFADDFLNFVRKTLIVNDHKLVWRFEFQPEVNRNFITCRRDDDNIILPQWFIDEASKN